MCLCGGGGDGKGVGLAANSGRVVSVDRGVSLLVMERGGGLV